MSENLSSFTTNLHAPFNDLPCIIYRFCTAVPPGKRDCERTRPGWIPSDGRAERQDRETIVADFDVTKLVYEKDVRKYSRRVRFRGGKEDEIAVVKAFLGCNTELFVKALDAVDAK